MTASAGSKSVKGPSVLSSARFEQKTFLCSSCLAAPQPLTQPKKGLHHTFRNKKGTIRSNTNYFCINSCYGSMLVYLSRNCLRKRFPINCQSASCRNASIISALKTTEPRAVNSYLSIPAALSGFVDLASWSIPIRRNCLFCAQE